MDIDIESFVEMLQSNTEYNSAVLSIGVSVDDVNYLLHEIWFGDYETDYNQFHGPSAMWLLHDDNETEEEWKSRLLG